MGQTETPNGGRQPQQEGGNNLQTEDCGNGNDAIFGGNCSETPVVIDSTNGPDDIAIDPSIENSINNEPSEIISIIGGDENVEEINLLAIAMTRVMRAKYEMDQKIPPILAINQVFEDIRDAVGSQFAILIEAIGFYAGLKVYGEGGIIPALEQFSKEIDEEATPATATVQLLGLTYSQQLTQSGDTAVTRLTDEKEARKRDLFMPRRKKG